MARAHRRIAALLLRWLWPLCGLAATLALSACAGSHPTGAASPGHEGAPNVRSFLLFPVNLVIALPPELESGVEPVQQAITRYVEAHDRRIERVSLPEARDLWLRAIEVAKSAGEMHFEAAAKALAQAAAPSHEFQALLIPSLIVGRGTVRHRALGWDGVKRHMRVVNMPQVASGRTTNVLLDGMIHGSLNANVAIASLHLIALSREGAVVFTGRGGIDILEELDLEDADKTFQFQLRPRDDVFQHREVVDEAVAIAFTPYLPPLEEP